MTERGIPIGKPKTITKGKANIIPSNIKNLHMNIFKQPQFLLLNDSDCKPGHPRGLRGAK